MLKIFLHIILLAGVLYVAIAYIDNVSLTIGTQGPLVSFLLLLAIVSGIEVVIHPIIRLLLLPIRLVTFGLISIPLSVGAVYLTTVLHPPFIVGSFTSLLLLGIAFAVVQRVVH